MTTSTRWWFAAFVVVVFFAGTSVGVIVDRAWLLARRPGPVRPIAVLDGRRPVQAAVADRLVEANLTRLANRLDLTSAQRDAARPLIEAWLTRIEDLQVTTRERLLAETQRFEQDVSPLLTPDQREQLAGIRGLLLVPTGRGARFGGSQEDGRSPRRPFRAGPGRPGGAGGSGRE